MSANRGRALQFSLLVFVLGALVFSVAVEYQVLGLPTSLSIVNNSVSMTVTGAPGVLCITDTADQIYRCTYATDTFSLSGYGVQDNDVLIFTADHDGYQTYFQSLVIQGVTYCTNPAQIQIQYGVSIVATAYFSYTPTSCSGQTQTLTTTSTAMSTGQSSTVSATTLTTTVTYSVNSPTTVTSIISGQTSTIQSTVTSLSVSTATVTTTNQQPSPSGFSLPQILLGALGVGMMGLGGGSALTVSKKK